MVDDGMKEAMKYFCQINIKLNKNSQFQGQAIQNCQKA